MGPASSMGVPVRYGSSQISRMTLSNCVDFLSDLADVIVFATDQIRVLQRLRVLIIAVAFALNIVLVIKGRHGPRVAVLRVVEADLDHDARARRLSLRNPSGARKTPDPTYPGQTDSRQAHIPASGFAPRAAIRLMGLAPSVFPFMNFPMGSNRNPG